MRPLVPVQASAAALAFLLACLLVACGEEGVDGDGEARPTVSITRTRTPSPPAAVPSPTRSPESESPVLPTPTRTADRTEGPELPSVTRTPDRTSTPEAPTNAPTSVPTTQEPPTQTPEASESPTTAPDDSPDEANDDAGVPSWVWWLLAAVVVTSAVAVPLVVRARRRGAWAREVRMQEDEVAWFARELLPGLRSTGSRERATGGWAVARTRVGAAEDRLTVLASSAPGTARAQRAESLRDAVRRARARMDALGGAEPAAWVPEVDAAITDLEAALRASPAPQDEQ